MGLPPRAEEGQKGSSTHVVGSRLDLLVQLVLVLVPEGWVAHQQDVQYHPCAEQSAGLMRCPASTPPSSLLPSPPLPAP